MDRRSRKWHTHKDDSDVIVVDFMPVTAEDIITNNYRRRHGQRPLRYIQQINAVKQEARSEIKNYQGLL